MPERCSCSGAAAPREVSGSRSKQPRQLRPAASASNRRSARAAMLLVGLPRGIDAGAANDQTPSLVPRPPSSTKICQKCKVRKPRADFAADVGNPEGPKGSLFCLACRTTLQTCLKCGINKSVCEFTHQSNRHGHCKDCYGELRRNVFAQMAALERALRPGIPVRSYYDQDPDEVSNRSKRRRADRGSCPSRTTRTRSTPLSRSWCQSWKPPDTSRPTGTRGTGRPRA